MIENVVLNLIEYIHICINIYRYRETLFFCDSAVVYISDLIKDLYGNPSNIYYDELSAKMTVKSGIIEMKYRDESDLDYILRNTYGKTFPVNGYLFINDTISNKFIFTSESRIGIIDNNKIIVNKITSKIDNIYSKFTLSDSTFLSCFLLIKTDNISFCSITENDPSFTDMLVMYKPATVYDSIFIFIIKIQKIQLIKWDIILIK